MQLVLATVAGEILAKYKTVVVVVLVVLVVPIKPQYAIALPDILAPTFYISKSLISPTFMHN